MTEAIWNALKPLLVSLIKKRTGKEVDKIYQDFKKSMFKSKFVNSLDTQLLSLYDNETFYNNLSKCFLAHIDKIYDWCYKRDYTDTRTGAALVEEMLSGYDWPISDKNNIRQILLKLLDSIFAALNEPKTDAERRSNNIQMQCFSAVTDRISELGKVMERVEEKIVPGPPLKIHSIAQDLAYKLMDDTKYHISLTAQDSSDYFSISVDAKYIDELTAFKSADVFLQYISFTGVDWGIAVSKLTMTDNNGNTISEYKDDTYTGPTLNITFYAPSISLADFDATAQRDLVLTIVPEKDYILWDLEDEHGTPVFQGVEFVINRIIQEDGRLQEIMIGTDSTDQTNIIFKFVFDGAEIVDSSLHIRANREWDAHSRLATMRMVDKMCLSKVYKVRDSKSHSFITQGNLLTELGDHEYNLEYMDFLKKVIALQDYFNTQFELPENIESEPSMWVDNMHLLITEGYSKMHFRYKTRKENLMAAPPSSTGNRVSFYLDYVTLFGTRLDLGEDLLFVIPDAEIIEMGDQVIISDKSFGVFSYIPVSHNKNIDSIIQKLFEDD